jgi:replication factor C small subunit
MATELWVEVYRPKKLSDYVWKNDSQRKQVERWITDGVLPHLILSGGAGIGKTSLVNVLFHELDVDKNDILIINASLENGVDIIRDKITNFSQGIPWGKMKYILLDEADYMSQNAQAMLRNLMESFHDVTRFILTCNYPHKIIPALKSRCQGYHFETLDKAHFTERALTILETEGIEIATKDDAKTLDSYIRASYPDLRKCINLLQQNSVGARLMAPSEEAGGGSEDYMIKMVDLFRANRITEARKLIVAQARPEDFEDIYRFLYRNVDMFGDTEELQNKAILIISRYLRDHGVSADPEICLSACLIELQGLRD